MRVRCRAIAFAAGLAALAVGAARADVLITVDKSLQIMTVSVDGDTRYIWPVSTGMAAYDTPAGEFKPLSMARHHYSREWDDAPMPYSIFFTEEGHAIHGSYEVRRLGHPASHGCVRLSRENAATLFALVKEQGMKQTQVVLTGEIPRAAKIAHDESLSGSRHRHRRHGWRESSLFYSSLHGFAPRHRFGFFFPW